MSCPLLGDTDFPDLLGNGSVATQLQTTTIIPEVTWPLRTAGVKPLQLMPYPYPIHGTGNIYLPFGIIWLIFFDGFHEGKCR